MLTKFCWVSDIAHLEISTAGKFCETVITENVFIIDFKLLNSENFNAQF